MTFARARLLTGIFGVGGLVTLTLWALTAGVPAQVFPTTRGPLAVDLAGLLGFLAIFVVAMLPLDVVGGVLSRHRPSWRPFARRWLAAVCLQSAVFLAAGMGILWSARVGGVALAAGWVALLCIVFVAVQGLLARLLTRPVRPHDAAKLSSAFKRLDALGAGSRPVIISDHRDPGFTGGVVGLPGRERIIVPRQWLELLTSEELAAALARRSEAIVSGSRTRGLLLAVAWVVSGFWISARLPGAGAETVAQLVATCCGFTCWTFLGLLTLPSISRQSARAIDRRVLAMGVSEQEWRGLLVAQDRLQDDEARRSAWIETIFHPVPSVENRSGRGGGFPLAWNAARMTLFLSWSCLGLLSRAVHCNAGRPELWVMLPAD